MKIKSGQILFANVINFHFLCVMSWSEINFVHSAVNLTLFFSLVLVLLDMLFWSCCLDSSLDWNPLLAQEWYSKKLSRWKVRIFAFLDMYCSPEFRSGRTFLSLQHWLGRAGSESFSPFELWLPKDEDKIMSGVLSVKVSHGSIALTTTTDAPEKHVCRAEKSRSHLRTGQSTTRKSAVRI